MTDDTEGFALFATDHPIEITEAMVAAGLEAGRDAWDKGNDFNPDQMWAGIIKAVFEAMCRAAPPEPDWDELPSEGSLVEATVEIKRDLWRPISSAPKPATSLPYKERVYVDLWVEPGDGGEGYRVTDCYWDVTTEGTGFWEDLYPNGTPTHWMPAPSPPSRGIDSLNNGT